MIVFKYFWRILWTYKITILIYFGIFGVISLLSAKQNSPAEYKEVKAEIAIIDEDQSELSRHLSKYLTEKNDLYSKLEKEDIEEQIYMGMFDAVLVIPKGFGDNPAAENIEFHKNILSSNSHKVMAEISSYMMLWEICRKEDGSMDYDLLEKSLAQKAEIKLLGTSEEMMRQNIWVKRYVNAAAYPVIGLVITIIGLGMADFNEKRVVFRNNASGYSVSRFQGQILLAQSLFGVILWICLILLGIVLSKGDLMKTLSVGYGLNLAVFIITILSFSFFINNVVKNKQALSAIGNIAALGSSFVCGVFIPLELLGGFVIRIARFLPTYYYVLANEGIYSGTANWQVNMGIQLLFAFVFILLGFYVAKVHQRAGALEL